MPKSSKQTSANVDITWFQTRLAAKGFSQRSMASKLGLDPSAMSLIIHGKRRLGLEESIELSKHLDVRHEELLSRFGVELGDDTTPGMLKVKGTVTGENLSVEWNIVKGAKNVSNPFHDKNISVVRVQATGTRFDGLHGALIFYRESKIVDPEAVGKPNLVRIKGKKDDLLRVVRRGSASGLFDLVALSGDVMEEDQRLERTSPVVWMKFDG